MKHVFLIHSHITFLVAKKITEEKQLGSNDCIYFATRGYATPDGREDKRFAQFLGYPGRPRVWGGLNVLKTKKNIQYCDAMIKEMVGDDFLVYLPQTMTDMANVIVTSSYCKGYYLIEEGFGSYLDRDVTLYNNSEKLMIKVLKLLFPRVFSIKSTLLYTDHPKFMGGYSLAKGIFPRLKDRSKITTIGIPFETISLDNIPDAILVLDDFNGLSIPQPAYFKVLDDTFAFMKRHKQYGKLAYKFHPAQYANQQLNSELSAHLQQLALKYDFDIFELPRSVMLESVAMTYKQIDFYSIQSSVLFYAGLMGNRSYTMANLVIEHYPQFKGFWDDYERLFAKSGLSFGEQVSIKTWA